MMHGVAYWLVFILLLLNDADRSLGFNEYANKTVTGGSCIEKERQALLIFQANLNEINDWRNEEEIRDCCKWEGVSCNNLTGHIIELDLRYGKSVGKISPSVKLLKQLQTLDLSGLDFQSNHILKSFGSLINLQYLYISNANLSGPIPRQLGNLTNLISLYLDGNSLVGPIPRQLGNLPNLSNLDLSSNSLVGPVPFSFGDLTNSLKNLNLSVNHLSGSVPNFDGCSSLSKLLLAHNSLNGSIPDFTGCETLQELDLSGNQLTGDLPNSVGQLSNLEFLDVSSNSLNGVISDLHFINLSRLTYLDMSFNSFSFKLTSHLTIPFQLKTIKLHSCMLGPSFPLWIKNQTSFEHLDISSAGISDSVPLWFWDLPLRLKFLNMSSNELRGTLPNITSNFFDYPGIDLSNNRFEGSVPLLPSKLASLNLSGNKLKGDISFLCHTDGELTFVDLSNNSFSGSLPDCWSKFPKLVVLDLSNNNLSGKIPLSFRLLYRLEALYLRKNAFVGELPKSLSNCTNLRFMDLGENKLSGKIPMWVGERLTRLYVLVLRSNMFNGSLPIQICWLYNLRVLDLSKNGFVGNVPRCFGNFTSMSSNRLSDDITSRFYSLYIKDKNNIGIIGYMICDRHRCSSTSNVFKESNIDNALVTWKGIDRSFGSGLKLLRSIDLSNNSLFGELPFEITRLVELVSLNISFNKLNGELPKDIGMLRSLDSLDLSRNRFSGKIPSSLSQLNGLGYLDLSYNYLSGKIPTGTQLQSFNSSFYEGNPLLYGPPLTPIFGPGPTPATIVVEEDDNDDFSKPYYTGMGAGFAVGFSGICGVIFFNRRCRHLLFASLSLAKDWIYVTVSVLFRKFKS